MTLYKMIKIALVGDYSIFRSGLSLLLETEENFKVVSENTKINDLADSREEERPDVVLLILSDKINESDSLPILSFSAPVKIPTIVLSSSKNSGIYKECLKLGINGLVMQDKDAAALFKAINKVHEGEYWFDRTLMGQTIQQLISESQRLQENSRFAARNGLTERENQIIDLICEGLKNKEIAGKLFVTETTVRHHLTSIFEKLNLTSRLELVVYAFKNHLVKIPVQSEIESNAD